MVYPTQYSKIVIEVKYCACPTSELNGWVIFVGKKSNYGLSQNCLRERRTLGMFFFSTFLLSLSCFLMSFFPFLLFLFPLLPPPFFALFSRSAFCPFSPVLHSFMLSFGLYTISCPSFLSSTLFSFLPLYYHSVCPSYVSFSFDCFIYFFCIF